MIGDKWPESGRQAIGDLLPSKLFRFKREVPDDPESEGRLEKNILSSMSFMVKSDAPLLVAAQVNTQMEFERTYRTLVQAKDFDDKRLVFISGLNIDIYPREGQLFPLTKFAPWAAFVKDPDGKFQVMEQGELCQALFDQSEINPDQVDLEEAIHTMADAIEVKIKH